MTENGTKRWLWKTKGQRLVRLVQEVEDQWREVMIKIESAWAEIDLMEKNGPSADAAGDAFASLEEAAESAARAQEIMQKNSAEARNLLREEIESGRKAPQAAEPEAWNPALPKHGESGLVFVGRAIMKLAEEISRTRFPNG